MRRSPEPRTSVIVHVAIVAVGVLYLLTRQHTFAIDSLYYLWDTEFGGWQRLWHPHHLAVQPLMRGVWRLAEWFAWPGRAVLPLQIWNVVLTMGALVLMWRLLARLVSAGMAAAWLAVYAFSYLTWFQATQIEGGPPFSLLTIAVLMVAVTLAHPRARQADHARTRSALLAAAITAAAVLVHQSLVLWAPLVAWFVARAAPSGHRARTGALTIGLAAAIVLAAYAATGAWTTGTWSPTVLWSWATGYSEEFADRCGALANMISPDVPMGLALSLLTGAPLKAYVFGGREADAALLLRAVPYALVGTVFAGGLAILVHRLRKGAALPRRALLHIALLTAVAMLFAMWWEPVNRKFWAPVLPGLVILAAVGVDSLAPPRRRLATVAVATAAAVLLSFNLAGGILPRHHHHDGRQPLLAFMARHVNAGDAVILQEDRVWQCAIYFQPDQRVHGIPGPFSDRDDPQHSVLQAALADARRALAAGHTLFVSDQEWPTIRAHLNDLGPLPRPEVVLVYTDWELGRGARQRLLAIRWPVG